MSALQYRRFLAQDMDNPWFIREAAQSNIPKMIDALQILAHSPQIGRPVQDGMRELVIGRAARGYVALYHHVAAMDTVFVLALRAQREAGYQR